MVTSIIKHPQHLWESSHLVSFWWSKTWLRNLSVWISCFGIFTFFHLSYQIYTGDLFTDEEGCQDLPGGGRRDFNRSSSCCSPRWYISVPVHGQFVPLFGGFCWSCVSYHTFFFTVHNVMQTTAWGGKELDKTSCGLRFLNQLRCKRQVMNTKVRMLWE